MKIMNTEWIYLLFKKKHKKTNNQLPTLFISQWNMIQIHQINHIYVIICKKKNLILDGLFRCASSLWTNISRKTSWYYAYFEMFTKLKFWIHLSYIYIYIFWKKVDKRKVVVLLFLGLLLLWWTATYILKFLSLC